MESENWGSEGSEKWEESEFEGTGEACPTNKK